MKITFENEHGTYTLEEKTAETWIELMHKFVNVLQSAGYVIDIHAEELTDALYDLHENKVKE